MVNYRSIEYFDTGHPEVRDGDAWWFDGSGWYFFDSEGVWVGPWDSRNTAESAQLEAVGAFV